MENNALPERKSIARDDRKLIDALRRSKTYLRYEKVFTAATGLPLSLRSVQSFDLPFHGQEAENAFCAFLADRKGACRFCLQTQERLARNQTSEARSVRCPFGLTETGVPVRLGDRVVGYLHVGQVFTHKPNPASFKTMVRQVFCPSSPEAKKATELWKKTQVIPAEKYSATVALLTFFAGQLSGLSNQIAIEEDHAEPAMVSRARAYIAAHKSEPLSLGEVAKAAGASVFHFCKVFHKATGLSFTDYLARARVEDARSGLRNPARRISEIAFDVGFQSLTQFNRTFRRTFGQSPTEYRARVLNRSLTMV